MAEQVETFRIRSTGVYVLIVLVTLFGATLCYLVSFRADSFDLPWMALPVIYAISVVPVVILVVVARRLRRFGFIAVGPEGFQHALAMRKPAPWDALSDLALEIRLQQTKGGQHTPRRAILHLSGQDIRQYARIPLKDPTRLSVDIDGAVGSGGKRDVEALITAIERYKPVSRRQA